MLRSFKAICNVYPRVTVLFNTNGCYPFQLLELSANKRIHLDNNFTLHSVLDWNREMWGNPPSPLLYGEDKWPFVINLDVFRQNGYTVA